MSPEKKILILTGDKGRGKTSLCLKLNYRLKKRGRQTAGVISPALFEGSEKTGILLMNAANGEKYPLAELRQDDAPGPGTERWLFNQESVDTGNRILENINECDHLIIDELGPLEFYENKGWTMGFESIEQGEYKSALVIIRPELLAFALQRWPGAEVYELSSRQSMDEAVTEILALLDFEN